MSSPCVGPEFTTDATGAVRIQTPRAVEYPYAPNLMSASNGLMLDPVGGLWVPQTPWITTSQQAQAIGLSVSLAAGATYVIAPTPYTAITNPSAVFSTNVEVEWEWQVAATAYYQSEMEMWGGYTWASLSQPSTNVLAREWMGTAVASTGSVAGWTTIANRSLLTTLAAGASVSPVQTLTFKSVASPNGNTVLNMWRINMMVTQTINYPSTVV